MDQASEEKLNELSLRNRKGLLPVLTLTVLLQENIFFLFLSFAAALFIFLALNVVKSCIPLGCMKLVDLVVFRIGRGSKRRT